MLFDEATATDVVPTFERMAAATFPEDVLLKHPPRVLGARQGRETPRHTHSRSPAICPATPRPVARQPTAP
ncbi:hypothetical protein NKH18_49345 [Streptomyces sp. M10(2022)]